MGQWRRKLQWYSRLRSKSIQHADALGQLRHGDIGSQVGRDRSVSGCSSVCRCELQFELLQRFVAWPPRLTLLLLQAIVVAFDESVACDWTGCIIGRLGYLQWDILRVTGKCVSPMFRRYVDCRLGIACQLDSRTGLLSKRDAWTSRWNRRRPEIRCFPVLHVRRQRPNRAREPNRTHGDGPVVPEQGVTSIADHREVQECYRLRHSKVGVRLYQDCQTLSPNTFVGRFFCLP